MFNASQQNYNRRKILTIITLVNIAIVIIIANTSGTFSLNSPSFTSNKTQTTISIQRFSTTKNIQNSEQISEQTPEKITPKESIPVDDKTKKIKEEVPNEKISSTENQSPTQNQNNTQSTPTNNQQNSDGETTDNNPATEPSHFGLNNIIPKYPIISFQLGESGDVTIEYIVSADGTLLMAKIIESSGFERLDRASLSEFKKWKFKPAKNIFGNPVQSKTKTITFSFNLQKQTIVLEEK